MKSNFYRVSALVLSVLFGVTIAAALVSAATTISTNIQTDGTLSVTGQSTFTGNVGIGTTTPAYGLTVATNDLAITSTNGAKGRPTLWLSNQSAADNAVDDTISDYGSDGVGFNIDLDRRSSAGIKGLNFWAQNPAGSFRNIFGIGLVPNLIFNRFPDSGYPVRIDWNAASTSPAAYLINLGGGGSSGAGIKGIVVQAASGQTANLQEWQNSAGSALTVISNNGSLGVGTSTPIANFQVANGNATTTMEIGSSGENKGSCMKLYRTDGSAIYAYVAAGATTFTLSTTACANVSGF